MDLGTPLPIDAVTVGFLQDIDSWIWMPTRLIVSVSDDGRTWRRVGGVRPEAGEHEEGALQEDLTVLLRGRTARYVRVQAANRGTCPPLAQGGGARGVDLRG